MLEGRDAPALPFTALQHRQLLARTQRLDVQRAQAIPSSIERIKRRLDILLTTHTAKLAMPTDKRRVDVTTGTTVAQEI